MMKQSKAMRKPIFSIPKCPMKQRSDTVQTDASFEEMMMMESNERGSNCGLLTTLLPTALQIHLLSYLSEPDLYQVGQVNRHMARLLLLLSEEGDNNNNVQDNINTESGDYLWRGLLEQRWPCLKVQSSQTTTVTTTTTLSSPSSYPILNKRLLLKLAADTTPTTVNKDRLVNQLNAEVVVGGVGNNSTNSHNSHNNNNNNNMAIRFTGRIGMGDRSFRADQPFPRPNNFRDQNKAPQTHHYKSTTLTRQPKWWNRIVSSFRDRRRRRHHSILNRKTLQPFVVPFRQDKDSVYIMTPRLIAYYEASILPATSSSSSSSLMQHHGDADNTDRECVAVGLSTYRFELHRRLPGWDAFSFAYHGDDGLIFHHQTTGMKYGPTFGVGSIVGCGLDYSCGRIFYTLNGKFLGYTPTVLDDAELSLDWFPTVGLDTHAAVQCNFGIEDRPFCFDLATMVDRQNQTITQVGSKNKIKTSM